MNAVLRRWNGMEAEAAAREVLPCCGSEAWARGMAGWRPIGSEAEMLAASEAVFAEMGERDWMEAFGSHPRIGESKAAGVATAVAMAWSGQEQGRAMSAEERWKAELVEGNARYEARFGRTFLVCASGRSAEEIVSEMERRMGHDDATEMLEAAGEQRKITALRLAQWMNKEA